jgi:hypothetical protein
MPEGRKVFEVKDADFGGGAWVPWKCVLPMKWVPQVPGSPATGLRRWGGGASHLGTGAHGHKTDRSRPRSVPVNGLPSRDLPQLVDERPIANSLTHNGMRSTWPNSRHVGQMAFGFQLTLPEQRSYSDTG